MDAPRPAAVPPNAGSAPTVCASATVRGGVAALLRLSGPRASAIAAVAGVPDAPPWHVAAAMWPLAGGACPCRVLHAPAARSATGHDLVEIIIPGASDLVELALDALVASGAERARPGAFARQALATGRLALDQAEATLALATAPDAAAATRALARLRGDLGRVLGEVRDRLLALRARVEAGLDFVEEDGVGGIDAGHAQAELTALRAVIAPWRTAALAAEGEPLVVLAGPANAGKSALFARLSGAPVLVSPVAGTTRDALEETVELGGRRVRLADTAGWLAPGQDGGAIDATAVADARRLVDAAALVVACSAPDAPLPAVHELPPERTLVVATKADLGDGDPRAALAVSAERGDGIAGLEAAIAERLASVAAGEPRQQRLLAACDGTLAALVSRLPPDELLAEDLRRCADLLGELIGATTTDDVLAEIFARFCIGK